MTPKVFALRRDRRRAALVACLAATLLGCATHKLSASEDPVSSFAALPNAPSAVLLPAAHASLVPTSSSGDVANKYHRIVKAGQQAVPLTAKDKLVLSIVDRASISSVASSAFSSGLGYWRDDTPHYGLDLPAYGERFGAAYLKATSESIFSYGVYAALFHDDPRYYVMGDKEKITKRAIYAATRVVITRKDDGTGAVNWPKLAGITSAAALTNAYYPERDRRVGRTATSVISSIGTTAAINELHEFIGDAMHLVFHKHDADK